MKKATISLSMILWTIISTQTSCEKITNSGPGHETFFVSSPNAVFPVTVTVTSLSSGTVVGTGSIQEQRTTPPNCEDYANLGVYSFSSSLAGTTNYTMKATDKSGRSWSGSFSLYYGYCHLYEMTK